MTEINNYTLLEFLNCSPELVEQYMTILRYINPIETKRKVFNMKLKHVEMIKRNLGGGSNKELIEIVAKVQKKKEDDILDMPIINFFGLVNSITEQIKQIIRAEENALVPTRIDVKWEMVRGSERMAKYGIYNTLDHLTGKKPHLYKQYMNMEFAEIFTILRKWKEEGEIQHEMSQIKID